MDYAGPWVSAKGYLRLFICHATRAVYLETAFSLNTTDFLNELSQMVATRGKPVEVASDNGKNFAGAESIHVQYTRPESGCLHSQAD